MIRSINNLVFVLEPGHKVIDIGCSMGVGIFLLLDKILAWGMAHQVFLCRRLCNWRFTLSSQAGSGKELKVLAFLRILFDFEIITAFNARKIFGSNNRFVVVVNNRLSAVALYFRVGCCLIHFDRSLLNPIQPSLYSYRLC